jgi:hypothetical protein
LFVCGAAPDDGCAEGLFSALPGLGSETATVLFGWAAGDCPEAEVVKIVTDVNANATEVLMHAPRIDTFNLPPEATPK